MFQKDFKMKLIYTMGVYKLELEAFRAIPMVFGHLETFNLGIQLQNSPFSYINDIISKIVPLFDGLKNQISRMSRSSPIDFRKLDI